MVSSSAAVAAAAAAATSRQTSLFDLSAPLYKAMLSWADGAFNCEIRNVDLLSWSSDP